MYNKNRNTSISITAITTKDKGNNMSKDNKEEAGVSTEAPAKSTKKKSKNSIMSVIMGISMALVFVSIAWLIAIVGMGTDWTISTIVMLTPAAAFDLFILFYAFSKIFK